ncbi:hypothetical protein OG533_39945 (plasmid) [Streptomyces sp. NBC_01186]|uniref:hypothetical protein n=1 Tax=Streptomyces sp. NBC_01186 TaxID=2903765 RepID=UPI002E0D80F6|nr:hypothetical protein OG533_39945 [Streptomyces sp. NBC_01186]
MAKQPTLVTEKDRNMLGKAMRSLDKSLLEDKEAVRKPFWVMAATWNLAPANDGLFKGKERPAKDKLDSAWRQVEEHAALLRSNPLWSPLWRQVQQAGEVKDQWQLRARASLQNGWKNHVEGNPAWEELWAYTEQKSSSARACLSAALADQMEREGIKDTRTAAAVDALREFSRTAAGYSRRPKEPLPPALGKETNATLNLHPGYGPHRGAVREEGDGQLIEEEVREGGGRVNEAFKSWFLTDMGQKLFKEHFEEPKGELEGPKAELQRLISEAYRKHSDHLKDGAPLELMWGLGEGKSLWWGLLHRRPSEFVEWADRAKKGAEWYGIHAGHAYELMRLARKANRLEPGSYSAHDIGLLKDFGDTSRIHAERLARTMTPGNRPDAKPYATPLDARAANLELAGQLNAWRDSKMGQDLLYNPLRPRSEAVVELTDALRAQLPFSVRETKAEGEHVARGGAYEYDQWEASYRVLRVAKAAQGVLDEAAYEAAWGTRRSYSENDKEWLRKVVATATNNAARLNRALVSRSVFPEKPQAGRTAGKPAVQPPGPSASAEQAAGTPKTAVAPGVVAEAQNPPWVQEAPQRTSQRQGPRQQNPQRSRQQTWQRSARRVRPPSQEQQAPRPRIPGYGPHKGVPQNWEEEKITRQAAVQASEHVYTLIKPWRDTPMFNRLEVKGNAALKELNKALNHLPPPGMREWPQKAAHQYAKVAQWAHLLGEVARDSNERDPGSYSAKDLEKLDSLADAFFQHAERLGRSWKMGIAPNGVAYESPDRRKTGDKEMLRRWEAFRKTDWVKSMLDAEPRDPLVQQLVSAWDRRNPTPYDEWTAADRMAKVGVAANRLLKEYSGVADHAKAGDSIIDGLDKLRPVADGAPKHSARLAQGAIPSLGESPKKLREQRRKESQSSAQPASQARQASKSDTPSPQRRTQMRMPPRPTPRVATTPTVQKRAAARA